VNIIELVSTSLLIGKGGTDGVPQGLVPKPSFVGTEVVTSLPSDIIATRSSQVNSMVLVDATLQVKTTVVGAARVGYDSNFVRSPPYDPIGTVSHVAEASIDFMFR
jgi:hypothetical protein